ncbi:hypothetical protein KSP40_PGU003832 [Platanthera guangdongensis]|uniref:AIR9 PH-like domain-containing protein n=1 Tax=Platanthera guangdongensis TaxID=2320717 RepID=A0ABR2LEJ3_9ASPA
MLRSRHRNEGELAKATHPLKASTGGIVGGCNEGGDDRKFFPFGYGNEILGKEALIEKDKKVPGVGNLERKILEVNRNRVKVVKPEFQDIFSYH